MNRLWLRSFALMLCIAQFVVAANFTRAEEQASGEKLLPKDTLAFFTISDIPELRQKWDKSSMGQILHDPQMKPFLEDVQKKIDSASDDMEKELGVSIYDLLDLPQGELSIAILEKPARKIAAVLMLEYGDQQETIDKLLKKMDEQLEKEQAEHSTEETGGVTLHVYTLKNTEGDNPFKTIVYFTDESYLVLSNEVAAIKEVVERWEGKSDDTLAQNEQFKYIQEKCKSESDDPLIKWYVNPIGAIQTAISMIPQAGMAGAFLPMLGIDGLKGWGGTAEFDEGDFEGVVSAFVYSDKAAGLMGVFQFPAAQLVPPKWVPAEIGSYFVANWNIAGAYTSIETLVDSFQGRGATARFLDSIADQGPMINPKKDLIDQLDGKIHVLQSEPKDADAADQNPTPNVFVGLGLKDAAKMKKTLGMAAKAASSNMETREFNGETIYEVGTPNGDQSFSIAVTEGQLVITNDTPLLEGMMRGRSGKVALVDSPEFKKMAKFFPSKTSMMSFQRSDVQIKALYNLLKNSDTEWEGIDVSKLPSFEVIAKYFQTSGGYTVPDAKGAKSVTFSLKRSE